METVEELKKYVRFLYASLQEKNKENVQMRKDMSEIKEELERFMDEQKAAADEKKALLRKIETLENRLSMANQSLYGGSKTCRDQEIL